MTLLPCGYAMPAPVDPFSGSSAITKQLGGASAKQVGITQLGYLRNGWLANRVALLGGAGMSRDMVVTELVKGQAKSLRMPGLARVFKALGRQAREEKWSPEDYLHEVLSAEPTSRADSAVRQRLHEARFPEMKAL